MINKRRLINTFKKLVRIDSLSLQEGRMIKYLVKELRALGLQPSQAGKPAGGEVGSLVVDVPGRGMKKPRILLNAHIDTVSPGKKIKPSERRGVITSDGSTVLGADNKTGVSAILEALRTLKKKKLPHPPLRVIFTVAEEIGLRGAKALPKSLLKADFGLVLDGGDVDEIIVRAPSQDTITATILGKAAHAGLHPEEGINAIKVASAAIVKIKQGRIDKETTANIGVIKGGKATNIVPDRVELKAEARSHNAKKLKEQVRHMTRVLRQTCAKHKAKIQLKVAPVYRSFEVKKSAEVLKLATRAASKAGLKPKVKPTGGGSDANIFNAAGIPSVIVGMGADHVHTARERVAIKDLVKGAEIVLDILQEAGS